MEWELEIDGAETCNEVILKDLYGSFGIVSSVEADWCQLDVNVFVIDFFYQCFGWFVI